MRTIDYEVEYNNRARVPEHPAILARWQRDAAAFRASHKHSELGLAYGKSERQKIDLFWPGAARAAPIALFLHGGYWRALERESFSHMAAGANARGLAFALAGYELCPTVMISEIIEQVREAAAFLGRRHGGPIVACGHSAGGHLAGCLVATDWKQRGADLPAEDAVLDPELANPSVGASEREAVGRFRVREERRVEVHADFLALGPFDPTLKMLGANLVAIDSSAAELAVEGV